MKKITDKLLGFDDLFSTSFSLLTKNFGSYFLLILLQLVPAAILMAIFVAVFAASGALAEEQLENAAIILICGGTVFFMLAIAAYNIFVTNTFISGTNSILENGNFKFGQTISTAANRWLPQIWTQIIFALLILLIYSPFICAFIVAALLMGEGSEQAMTGGGVVFMLVYCCFLILVIPINLVFNAVFGFSQAATVISGVSGVNALKRSRETVRNRVFKAIFYFFGISLIAGIVGFIVNLATQFVFSFSGFATSAFELGELGLVAGLVVTCFTIFVVFASLILQTFVTVFNVTWYKNWDANPKAKD